MFFLKFNEFIDMLAWMRENRIENYYEVFKKHGLNGCALMELKTLAAQTAYFTFSHFEKIFDRVGIEEIGQVLQISAAIRKL